MVFLNLTNGLEYEGEFDGFIRIQSTACEQKRWDFILQELDYSFLLPLYLGKEVIVVDYGARKDITRAAYQGIEWVKYALNRRWFEKEYTPNVKGHNCTKYFDEVYNKLDTLTKKKLDYVKRFKTNCNEIKLKTITYSTIHDGDNKFYSDKLHKNFKSLGET